MSKRYLTVLAGSPRGGELTWQSLYINVLNHLNSDLAICTGNEWLNNQSFIKRAKYLWNFEEPEDWFEYYRENFQGNWEEYFNLGKSTGLYNSGSIHFALKDIILRNHSKVFKEYDTIIYTRFDQFYIDKHPNLDSNKIWIPEGEDYYGICDRHTVLPSEYIEKYLDICSFIDSPSSLKNTPEHLNCEAAYMHQLESNNLIKLVSRYKRNQFTSAIKNDSTNWRVPEYKVYFYSGLEIKYPDEFIAAVKNYKKLNGIIKSLIHLRAIYINYVYLSLRRGIGNFKNTILPQKNNNFKV